MVAVAKVDRLRQEEEDHKSVVHSDLGTDKLQQLQHNCTSLNMYIPEISACLTLTRDIVSNMNMMFEEGKRLITLEEKSGEKQGRTQGSRTKEEERSQKESLRKENATYYSLL